MTEPLLFGTTLVVRLAAHGLGHRHQPCRAAAPRMVDGGGVPDALRSVADGGRAGAPGAAWRDGDAAPRFADLMPVAWQMARYPIGAAIFFLFLSRATVGEWFVSGGFYVPDAEAAGTARCRMGEDSRRHARPERRVAGEAGADLDRRPRAHGAVWRQGAALLVPLGMFAAAALPFSAFLSGHPFRIRYEIPIVVASALSIGLATGLLRKAAPLRWPSSSWSWSAARRARSTPRRRWCAKRSSIARTASAARP